MALTLTADNSAATGQAKQTFSLSPPWPTLRPLRGFNKGMWKRKEGCLPTSPLERLPCWWGGAPRVS